jgi:hypothetical protein
LDLIDGGFALDLMIEKSNDDCEWATVATEEDVMNW